MAAIQSAYGSPPSGPAGGALSGTYPNPGIVLDSTAADIVPVGAQAAGAVGKPADSGHVHPWSSGEPLTSGELIIPRAVCNSFTQLATQTMCLTYWTAIKTETCNTVTTITSTDHSTTPTYSAVGIYTVAGNGNLTLNASTGDLHASMWTGAFGTYAVALTSSFSKVAGTRYAFAVLTVDAGGPCQLVGANSTGFYNTAPAGTAILASQTTLPSTVTAGSLGVGPPYGFYVAGQVGP